jgi:proteasome lid subunit RPN8/RPN11
VIDTNRNHQKGWFPVINSNVRVHPQNELPTEYSRIPYQVSIEWHPVNGLENTAKPAVRVFITQPAFKDISAHAASDMDHEVGGWLLGHLREDKHSTERYAVVDTILPAEHTASQRAFLTFTQDSQVALHTQLEDQFPEKVLLGWFHTHPRMGVFLSSYDTWLHNHFFPERWHIALVVEPHSKQAGLFIRDEDGNLDPRRYFGFYELNNAEAESIVDWRNMALRSDPPRSEK